MKLNKNKAGLLLASFLGLWHLTWSLLVAIGAAQTMLDWIYALHFLNNPFQVGEFRFGTAILLIFITSSLGYLFGWMLAFLWNTLHKQPSTSN